ncbi:TraI domain-containing protein [Thiomicrorhabdus sediminis]|uniref:HD domain-containing protein n=1 Tax=Thiomicrorhabdus sediminis TaxID=2580412 RepID=A0A4P9K7U3_9GAMM|nr:TraI domain-containing protein [Thiomicrorhabdus sediminis]QCU91001.1 HD domain-containing protein [Thiomicrorhabdus sediminis]
MKPIITYSEQNHLQVGKGKQRLGYAGVFGHDLGCSDYGWCQVSLIDQDHLTHYINVDNQLYSSICQRYESLHLQSTESLYLWVELDANEMALNWRLFKSTLTLEQLFPIYQACYDFGSLYQLFDLIESLQVIPLRMFAREVLMDTSLMTTFVSIPASKRHHHSFPGGLLMHSLECAFMTKQTVEALLDISTKEKEVAVVAALFHDIGKVKTLGLIQHTSAGRLIDHEQFTLMMLAEPLNTLQEYWQSGAEALQYLLTWKESQGMCRYVTGNAIKMADRLSTSASLNSMAFQDKPDYFHFAELSIGCNKHYLNRLN